MSTIQNESAPGGFGGVLFRSTKVIRTAVVAVAGAALVALMLGLSFDATGRYLIGTPNQWLPSISADILLPVITILPMLLASLGDDHVRMGFVYDKFPERVRAVIDRIGYALAVVFWGLVAWISADHAFERFGRSSITGTEVPEYITLLLVAIGALLMAYVCLVQTVVARMPALDEHDQSMDI